MRFNYSDKYSEDEVVYDINNPDQCRRISDAQLFKFSPDGSLLLVYHYDPHNDDKPISRIYVYTIDGDEIIEHDWQTIDLTNIGFVDFVTAVKMTISNDNKLVALHILEDRGYGREVEEDDYIVVIDIDANDIKYESYCRGSISSIAFTPGGNYLIYCTYSDAIVVHIERDEQYDYAEHRNFESDIAERIMETQNSVKDEYIEGKIFGVYLSPSGKTICYIIQKTNDENNNERFLRIENYKGITDYPIDKYRLDSRVFVGDDNVTLEGVDVMHIYTPDQTFEIDIEYRYSMKASPSSSLSCVVGYYEKIVVFNMHTFEQAISFISSNEKNVYDESSENKDKMLGKPAFDMLAYSTVKALQRKQLENAVRKYDK
jgi:hypothetical protein